jgi:hypothetical protein
VRNTCRSSQFMAVPSKNVRSGLFNNLQLLLRFVECGTFLFSLPCSPAMI